MLSGWAEINLRGGSIFRPAGLSPPALRVVETLGLSPRQVFTARAGCHNGAISHFPRSAPPSFAPRFARIAANPCPAYATCSTFYFIRCQRNPAFYGLPTDLSDGGLYGHMQTTCLKGLKQVKIRLGSWTDNVYKLPVLGLPTTVKAAPEASPLEVSWREYRRKGLYRRQGVV